MKGAEVFLIKVALATSTKLAVGHQPSVKPLAGWWEKSAKHCKDTIHDLYRRVCLNRGCFVPLSTHSRCPKDRPTWSSRSCDGSRWTYLTLLSHIDRLSFPPLALSGEPLQPLAPPEKFYAAANLKPWPYKYGSKYSLYPLVFSHGKKLVYDVLHPRFQKLADIQHTDRSIASKTSAPNLRMCHLLTSPWFLLLSSQPVLPASATVRPSVLPDVLHPLPDTATVQCKH